MKIDLIKMFWENAYKIYTNEYVGKMRRYADSINFILEKVEDDLRKKNNTIINERDEFRKEKEEIKSEIEHIHKKSMELYDEMKQLVKKLSETNEEGIFIEACCAIEKWEDMDLHLERIENHFNKMKE